LDPFASVFIIPKLAKYPSAEIATQANEANTKFLCVISVINDAKNVPSIIARYVKAAKIPLALLTLLVGTISGIIPNLDGPKIALCVAIKKSRE